MKQKKWMIVAGVVLLSLLILYLVNLGYHRFIHQKPPETTGEASQPTGAPARPGGGVKGAGRNACR